MPFNLKRSLWLVRYRAKIATGYVLGAFAIRAVRLIRRMDSDRAADWAAAIMRRLGPLLPEHRTGRANLRAAFPDKSSAEINAILRGVWDNLGRIGAEFAHLDRLWDLDDANPRPGRIELAPGTHERFHALRDDGKPALIFAAHLANWEMPALAAASHGLASAVLFRRPNVGQVDRLVSEVRSLNMGTLVPTAIDAPVRLANMLTAGVHVGMLVDQYFARGVEVTFFGRTTRANPLIARLARHIDCPIHGVRIIRLPGHRFRAELTEAIVPSRDADGQIDVTATMQTITATVESWIRDHPEQWLWVHRRWR